MIAPTLSDDGMRYWRLAPDVRLRPWVQCYWYVEPAAASRDPEASASEPPDLLIPDGLSELVFHLAGSFTRWSLGEPAKRARMRRSYVIGGRSRSVLTRSPGGLRLAGVKLDPRALRVLLRMPLTELRDATVECADLGCRALEELEDAIAGMRCIDELPGLFDRLFLPKLAGDLRDDAATERLLGQIRATHGAQPILKWAREERLDIRTLERRFLARMGMTPKQYARVLRFKQAYLRKPGHLDAFYDDSHFHREYRHFMGVTPVTHFGQSAHFNTLIGDHLLEGERQ